jgi:hypothetical protein
VWRRRLNPGSPGRRSPAARHEMAIDIEVRSAA